MTESGNLLTVSVELPALNPRKGIGPMVFGLPNAQKHAEKEYGDRLGPRAVSPSPTLENRLRTNLLKGEFVFELLPATKPAPSRKRKTTTKKATK